MTDPQPQDVDMAMEGSSAGSRERDQIMQCDEQGIDSQLEQKKQ